MSAPKLRNSRRSPALAGARPGQPLPAALGVAAHVFADEHSPRTHFCRQADGLDRWVAPSSDQVGASLLQRRAEVLERLQQERQPVGPGAVALQDGSVEHEQRHDVAGHPGRLGQRRVVVDPQFASQQDYGTVHRYRHRTTWPAKRLRPKVVLPDA